jgi:hypothetical protein
MQPFLVWFMGIGMGPWAAWLAFGAAAGRTSAAGGGHLPGSACRACTCCRCKCLHRFWRKRPKYGTERIGENGLEGWG